ncbi:hypothetical protein SUDANB105_05189 [Streptomyces sp. enrichment culture]
MDRRVLGLDAFTALTWIAAHTSTIRRLAAWRDGPVTDLLVPAPDVPTLRTLAGLNS